MVIDAVLLGTGGMLPLPGRWLSCLLMRANGDLTLFDCGEGTQIAWRASGWGFRRLGAICVSHTHADHVAGLPGLLHAVANDRHQIEIFDDVRVQPREGLRIHRLVDAAPPDVGGGAH